jgi:hypothetical protein
VLYNVLVVLAEHTVSLSSSMRTSITTDLQRVILTLRVVAQIGGREVPSMHGDKFGQGVYTATISAVSQRLGLQTRSVILSRALQGKTGKAYADTAAHSWPGGLSCIVFRDSAQLLPVFVVHF